MPEEALTDNATAHVTNKAAALAMPDVVAAIGNTPLIELDLAAEVAPGTRLFGKLESANPGGSLKDRSVAFMIRRAIAEGHLAGGRRLLDSSSGNAGIAYAMIGAALGIPVSIVVPGNASQERLQRIAAYGAELIITDAIEGYDFAVLEARRLAEGHPDRYWYCDQYSNAGNWRAHYHGTGQEILQQLMAKTGAAPDVFVAGVGTGGSITGIGRRLREVRHDIRIVSVMPDRFPGIEGLKPLGTPEDIVPEILDESLIDEHVPVTIEDAITMCRQLALRGIFVGPSSGAYVHAALQLASRGRYRSIVTLLCDTGERYSSTGMWRTDA